MSVRIAKAVFQATFHYIALFFHPVRVNIFPAYACKNFSLQLRLNRV